MKKTMKMMAAGLLVVTAGAASAQNLLQNPNFESPCSSLFQDWTQFGNVVGEAFGGVTGTRAAKMFGPFFGTPGYSGVFSEVPAAAGETWEASAYAMSYSWDALGYNPAGGPGGTTPSGSRGVVVMDFLDSTGAFLNTAFQYSSAYLETPNDPTHALLTVAPVVAPAGTAKVRITLYLEQYFFEPGCVACGGSVFWDDASLNRVGDVNALTNPSFETPVQGCGGSSQAYWFNFGNGQSNLNENVRNGMYAAKLFGGFNGNPAYSGWYQNVPAVEGEEFIANGWARSAVNDATRTGNDTRLGIEFFDEFGNNLIGLQAVSASVPTTAVGGTPLPSTDNYVFYETGTATAPEFTQFARTVILQTQLDFAGGATWWDDMSIRHAGVNPCPADFNGDSFVDDTDFVTFAAAYEQFTVPPADAAADLTLDGFVDDSDFVIFASAYENFVCP